MTLLLLTVLSVTPGEGWSWPILVTEEANTAIFPLEFIAIDQQNRFHLVWDHYQSELRIGYNVFLLDGTPVVPDTMISRDEWSAYLRAAMSGDSLFAFWREDPPVYYAARSLVDGSEITPATYLLSESTPFKHIRASADSLGRLHVLRNIGYDVYYARWTPVEPAGFNEDFCQKVEGAYITGEILVDGDRVHMVVGEYTNQTLEYIQYDLDGNITVPLFDFTPDDINNCRRPGIAVDDQHDFVVVDEVHTVSGGEPDRFEFWKINGATGEVMIDGTVLFYSTEDLSLTNRFDLVASQDNTFYYLIGNEYFDYKRLHFSAFDTEGNLIYGPTFAYDHSDEDPEDLGQPDGVTDAEGNLYIIYTQGETEPVLGAYPTFGWFDHDYLTGIVEQETEGAQPGMELTASSNPFSGTVTITCHGDCSPGILMVRDVTGRVIQTLEGPEGSSFVWDGRCGDGSEAPPGVYLVQGASSGRLSSVRVVRL